MLRCAFWLSTFIQQSARACVNASGPASTGSPPRAAAVTAPPRAPPVDPGERAVGGLATTDEAGAAASGADCPPVAQPARERHNSSVASRMDEASSYVARAAELSRYAGGCTRRRKC